MNAPGPAARAVRWSVIVYGRRGTRRPCVRVAQFTRPHGPRREVERPCCVEIVRRLSRVTCPSPAATAFNTAAPLSLLLLRHEVHRGEAHRADAGADARL